MRSEDITNAAFDVDRFSNGYDMAEVDEFLAAVALDVDALEGAPDRFAARRRIVETVRGARFAPTRYRDGYLQTEVDALLDRIALAFDAVEDEQPTATGRLTATEVADIRFGEVVRAPGYDMREVDTYLVRVVDALTELESGVAAHVPDVLRAEAVQDVRFTGTSHRPGYAAAEVDAFLNRLADAFVPSEG